MICWILYLVQHEDRLVNCQSVTMCNILVTTVGLGLYIKQVSFHSPRPLLSRSLVA